MEPKLAIVVLAEMPKALGARPRVEDGGDMADTGVAVSVSSCMQMLILSGAIESAAGTPQNRVAIGRDGNWLRVEWSRIDQYSGIHHALRIELPLDGTERPCKQLGSLFVIERKRPTA
jgi:hypothetical protein